MIAYYKEAEIEGPQILEKKITYSQMQDPNFIQRIKPEATLVPNKEYTVQELINRMIIYSDNESYTLLSKNPPKNILQVYSDLGLDISKGLADPTANFITVKDYATFFRVLFNASYLSPEYSEKALGILSQITYKGGLVAGMPKDIVVAHKFGERGFDGKTEVQLHDCGIAYFPKRPVLVCIMTRGEDMRKLQDNIRSLSATIANYWQNLKNK